MIMEEQAPNPYRPCCLNCEQYDAPDCVRIPGVRMYRYHPRKQNRCGYFKNKNINR